MLRWIASRHTAMDPEDVKGILDAAVRTLQRVPMTIDGTDEFFDYLRTFGCEIEGRRVRFNERVTDRTLARMVRERLTSRGQREDPPSTVRASTSGQAMYIAQTRDDMIRPCTVADLALYCRVQDAVPGLERSHPGFIPQDRPLKTQELHAFGTIILNSREPHRVSMFSPEVLPYYLDILEVVCGSREAAKAKARELNPSRIWVNTPFMISRENIEAPMLLRRLTGQPIGFSIMPVAGMATPVTPAGALALSTAEVIACNAMTLAVDDRLCGWCSSPLFFDMKSGAPTQWGPETLLMSAGTRHLQTALFGVEGPLSVTLGVAAKTPSAQSVYERVCHMAFNYACGARLFGALGTLANSDIVSSVQLMLDLELVAAFAKSAGGFEVNADTLAEAVMAEVIPRGAQFADTDHTAHHFRQVSWFPEFLDRRVPMAWVQNPSDMIAAAREKALRLEETSPNVCPLREEQRTAILRILHEADARLTRTN